MNGKQHFEEKLVLYAMRLLAEPEASTLFLRIAESEEGRQQLAQIESTLGIYAQAVVELQTPPEGSFERLMNRIAQESQASIIQVMPNIPSVGHQVRSKGRIGAILPWIGWALAAGLAITAGKLFDEQTILRRNTARSTLASAEASRQRDTLQDTVAAQQTHIQQLTTEVANTRTEADRLMSRTAEQSSKLNQQKTVFGQQETALADAKRQQLVLQGTVAAQANQVAGLTADAMTARRVLDIITDPAALKVTLTTPKSHPVPNGRAVYVQQQGTLVFLASNLKFLKSGKVYQLWLLPANGSSPVPAGTFSPDAQGNASVVYEQFPRPVGAKGFAVTIEASGGSQTPTSPLILAGTESS